MAHTLRHCSTPASQRHTKYPRHLLWLLWLYMWTMLGLFANFFYQNYTKKPAVPSAKKSLSKKTQ